MSSPSIVRVAISDDFSEVFRLLMESYAENALFKLARTKVTWFVKRALNPESISPEDTGTRGISGVIGSIGDLDGLVFLTVGSFWYSNDFHLEEMMIFVDPRHRKSGHAKALVGWMKSQSDILRLPLITGILSTQRMEAKCRLYQRMLPKIGEF